MLFRVQSLWTWIYSILTVLPKMEPVLEPSRTVSFQPTPVPPNPMHITTSCTPPPKRYPYPPIIERAVTEVDVTSTIYTPGPTDIVTTWSESTSYFTLQQTDDGGNSYPTVTSQVITVVVTSVPDSRGLSRSDKIALGVGIPAAVFTALGLFGLCIK